MEITGEVKEIIYQNEINSYTVAEFETKQEEITIVGYLPFINVGDTLKLVGKIVTHQDYGEQFKVDTFEKLMPQTLVSLERYLANGTIKGVGPATAKKIVDTFKEETIHVLKFEPQRLAQIKGINEEKALTISETFIENLEVWQIVGYLEKFGIGIQNAKNVYKKLGLNAIEEIEANPYILIDVANNVDFKKIDKMAIDIGLPYDNDKRIKSGIKYAITCTNLNGNCAVLKENLITFCKELLGVTKEEIEENIIDLKVNNQIVIETRNNKSELENIIDEVKGKESNVQNWVYLASYYKAEENIANRITILQNSPNIKKIKNIKTELKKIEKSSDIELSEKQKEAIEAVNENNVCIITGGPGTGKTTIIKTIIELYKKDGKKPVLCAPTGRAAKRMTETTGEEAKTLHRLLEIGKMEEESKIASVDYEVAPLDADIVIVDEVSMVDLFLMNYLIKALYQGTKLILVGDIDQLPSVGPGSILKDLMESEQVTTIVLNKIFRQAAKSKIILNAHRVNEGEKFLNKEEIENENLIDLNEDFFYINEVNQEKILYNIISLCKERLKNYGNYDFFKNIQVISPTKKGMLGTKELNKILQKNLNPENDLLAEKQIGDITYRENDRVMQIKNNYDIFWERETPEYETGTGVFNGELGTIIKINEQDKILTIKYDDEKQADYMFQDLDQIEHAYSITVHKSQRK
ncbi:MAG: AAA family ATPase [Clostridia bacterium]|nr:AAA family ATPase [Clostridia bacterium]